MGSNVFKHNQKLWIRHPHIFPQSNPLNQFLKVLCWDNAAQSIFEYRPKVFLSDITLSSRVQVPKVCIQCNDQQCYWCCRRYLNRPNKSRNFSCSNDTICSSASGTVVHTTFLWPSLATLCDERSRVIILYTIISCDAIILLYCQQFSMHSSLIPLIH